MKRTLCLLLCLAFLCLGCSKASAPQRPETAVESSAVVSAMAAPAATPALDAPPAQNESASSGVGVTPVPETAGTAGDASLSAWLPYWDGDAALSEAESLSGTLDTTIAFAAIFDQNNRPFLLPEAETLLMRLTERSADTKQRVLLSVVNDVEIAHGQYDNKSTQLLEQLLCDDESVTRHIEQLFQLVDAYHLDGLEIDYEGIKRDTALWARFMAFIERLYSQFFAQGLRLRVVLSWDTPKYTTLPIGPEYSVMCYNLFGGHSGPGPKADLAFLETTCGLYAPYGASVHMAFATGGFDWHNGGVTQLTQQQAEALLIKAGVAATRDLASGALYAAFRLDNEAHTVWYADAQTLDIWRETAAEHGFVRCDLFRLGGNNLADWQTALTK